MTVLARPAHCSNGAADCLARVDVRANMSTRDEVGGDMLIPITKED